MKNGDKDFPIFTDEQKKILEKIKIQNIEEKIKFIKKSEDDLEKEEEEEKKEENKSKVNKIKKRYVCDYPEKIDITCPLFKENNFILSKNSIEKCQKVYHYMLYQVPCILEGETGTSKSFTASMMAKYRKWKINEEEKKKGIREDKYTEFKYIKFNLSKETKISDLFGKYAGDSESLDGIKMIDGPFIEAFRDGHCLHLDEINLAPVSVLQCIEEALDTKVLSIEITGLPLKSFPMHPNFCLIATQNRRTKYYKDKRESAGIKFLSKFQIVNFEEFKEEELEFIAKGLRNNISKKEGRTFMDDNNIKKLIKFHLEWSKEKKSDFIKFTLRQIESCIEAFSIGEKMYNIIYNIYGINHEQQNIFEKIIQKYFEKNDNISDLPKEFPSCYKTESIKKIYSQVNFSFNNGSNVIIIGKKGCGKTQFALWIAEYYNKKYVNPNYGKEDVDLMICSEETSCADLIGKQILSKKEESGQSIIEWNYGFLLKGIKEGKCLVFDCIDEISSQVTERANNLFDLNLKSPKDLYFEVPENPNKKEQKVLINKNFRVIATCDENKLNKMSPAFINRFKIIYFEDQMINLDIEKFIRYKINDLDKKNENIKKEIPIQKDNKINKKNKLKERFKKKEKKDKIKESENGEKENQKEDLISRLNNKIKEDKNKIVNSFSFLNFFIESVYIFKLQFGSIKIPIIIDYLFQLIDPNSKNIIIDESIFNLIKDLLINKDSLNIKQDEKHFFFSESKELCTFLIKAYTAYLIHLHMRFEGPTGIGKTTCACYLAKMIMGNKKYYIQSFHSGTKPSECYGSSTILNNNILFKDGLLTLAMIEGSIFIADEFNLCTSETMKSFFPSLSKLKDYNIYIPGLGRKIKINENFIFIVCQNKVGTLGRNQLPPLIESSLREFTYPSHIKKTNEEIQIIENDIQNICVEINKCIQKEYSKTKILDEKQAKNIGKFMLKFNRLDKNYIQPLSFRDIKKIFKRIYYQKNENRKKNFEIFNGFKVYHNIIFYILSKLNKINISDIKIEFIDLIIQLFNIKKEDDDLNCYFENSLSIFKEKDKTFLQKGKCKIEVAYSKMFTSKIIKRMLSYINLQNFLNPLFNAIISSNDESLLFLGKTSCKTYLCKTLLQDNQEIINLNQETKVEQLLGGPLVLGKNESTFFYFKYLCYICGKSNNVNDLFEQYKKGELNERKNIKFKEKYGDKGFKYAIEKFKNILFDKKDNNNNNDENDLLSKYILVFKPGFILDALLKEKPFVLKNISNLYSDVLERFNQFFTEEQKIILIEDIYDTFTKKENKELCFFNILKNRVLATANSANENKFSEPILSRFSVINVESYEPSEEKIIIEMEINKQKNNLITNDEINHLISLFQKIQSLLQISITLAQKIKIINIISDIRKKITTDENIDFMDIILFNIFKGLFEFRTKESKKYKKFKKIFNQKNLWNYQEDKPIIENKIIGQKKVIVSNNTYLYLENSNANDYLPDDLAFTEQFCENLDIIHFSMKLKFPLILEGEQGQGKKTALNYIFKLLNIKNSNIINIYLSENTRKEDLLGKITATTENTNIKVDFIQTDLINALINENNDKYAIIFHNINKVSPGIFEILENIFDNNKETILLPNGDNKKKNFNNFPYLFGIFDSENGKINRNSLPSFLLRSCIYFIVQNPIGEDIRKIITSKFNKKPYKLESNYFEDKFLMATLIQNNYTSSNNNPLSLNDINKFISFRDNTYTKLDISIISQFIFVYRHSDNEKIQELTNKLQFNAFNFIPKFSYINKRKFRIDIEDHEEENKSGNHENEFLSDNYIELTLNTDKKINENDIDKKINTLTKPQKHCLLFLSCSQLSNCSIILQGNTNSGKSHLITLFAEILGKKLLIYQMNKDINSTMFFGQSMINELPNTEKILIKELCNKLSNYVGYTNKTNEWNPNTFNELCKSFENLEKNGKNYNEAKEIYVQIKDKISLTKRFEDKYSPFCEALNKGYWILIEQIESAPIEIIDKLVPLCGENPELKIIKGTKEVTYKRNNTENPIENIHNQFRIFFTYNPYNSDVKINSSLLSKCVVFTLPQVDSTPEYSAKMFYGSLKNINYPYFLSKRLSEKLSNTHERAKNEVKISKIKGNNHFSENENFTGRTINFILNEITNLKKNKMINNENITIKYLSEIIKSTFEHYYFNCYNDENNKESYKLFQNKIFNSFLENINIKIETGDDDLSDLYKDIYDDINKIEKFFDNKENLDNEEKNNFNLSNFFNKCMTIKLNHLDKILDEIKNLTEIINEPTDKKSIILGNYYSINIIYKLLNDAKSILNLKNKKLSNSKLIISDSILLNNEDPEIKFSCSKLILFNLLIKDKFIITDKITPEFFLIKINDFVKNQSLQYFEILISNLKSYPYLFERFKILFPFNKIINEKELTCEKEQEDEEEINLIKKIKENKSISILWLELFYIYWKNKIPFTINIDKNTYKFESFDNNYNSIINPTFIFENSSGFYLAKKSSFKFLDLEEEIEKEFSIEKVCRNSSYEFYQYLLEFSNYNKYVPTYDDLEKFVDNIKSEEEENLIFDKFKNEKQYFFNIEGIFEQGEILTPVNKILSTYFNYSNLFFIELKDKYFNEIQKQIYDLLLKFINEKLLKNDYILYSELIRNLNFFFKNNIDLFEELEEEEINGLNKNDRDFKLSKIEKALLYLKEINNKYIDFNFQYFIDDLEKKKKIIETINTENEKEIEKQNAINFLKGHSNDKNKFLIDNLKKKIEKQSLNINANLKENIYNIDDNKKKAKNIIKWPNIKYCYKDNYNNYSSIYYKHKIFIDILIRYSEIKQILNELENIEKKYILEIFLKLSEYEEMRNIANYIFNKINENWEISPYNKKVLNSVLNSSIIKNLWSFCFNKQTNTITLNILEEMFDYFNNLRKRIIDKEEIEYIIEKYSFKYNPDFEIIFPKFTALDLVYLFIDIKNIEDENIPAIGYLMEDIDIGKQGFDRLSHIEPKPINNFVECLNNISFIIFEELKYDINNANALPMIKKIYNSIETEKKDANIKIKKLCQILISLFDNKTIEILNKNYCFNLEDDIVLDKIEDYKYLEDQSICKNYPSLVYFLTENKIHNKDFFVVDNISKNNMPFWLFCLRYYSSLECIVSKEKNYFSTIIDMCLKNLFLNESKKKVKKQILGRNWLNLICTNKIPQFYEPLYEKIKIFLYHLSKDEYLVEKKSNSYINQQIERIFHKLIEEIINQILDNNKLINYYTDKDNNNLTKFFKNPNKYLFDEINDDIVNILSNNIDENKVQISLLIDNITKIEEFDKEELDNVINNELKKKNDDYKEIIEINDREYKDRLIKSIMENLNNYNLIFQELIKIETISINFQEKTKKILDLYEFLEKFSNNLVKNDETIELFKISYFLKENINITIKSLNDKIIISENKGDKGEFFVFKNQLNDIAFRNIKNEKILNINKNEYKLILHSLKLKEEKNFLLLDRDNYNDIKLLFGSENTLFKFNQNFDEYKNTLKELKNKLKLLINKKDIISNCNFNNNKIYKKYINNFISLCSVKFSDGSKCEVISEYLINLKKILEQILSNYILISNKFVKLFDDLEINTRYNNKILQKVYELKEIPQNIKIKDLVDFSEINLKGSLSVPIINFDQQANEISCSVNEIKCQIGPIYPSLYSDSFKLNILNFSYTSLSLNLIKEEQKINKDDDINDYYINDSPDNLITFKDKIDGNKSIEIEIKLPKIKLNTNLKEIHFIKFNLEMKRYIENSDENKIIESKSFILPFIIRLELMPIIIMFSTKNKKFILDNGILYIRQNLYSKEHISFKLEQIQLQQKIKLRPYIQIEGLKNNKNIEPKIIINEENNDKDEFSKNSIDLIIQKNNDEKTKMNIAINIFYTDTFKIPIIIDADIVPFNYYLLTYDYNSKEYKEENCIIKYNFKERLEDNNILNINLKLQFPNEFHNNHFDVHFSFENEYSQSIEILNEEDILNTKTIKDNYYFEIKIRINKKYFPSNDIPKLVFISDIHGIKKKTDITFINEENDIESINEYYKLEENNIIEKYVQKNKDFDTDTIYYCIENLGIKFYDEYINLKNNKINSSNSINLRRDYMNMEFNNINMTKLPEIKRPEGIMSIQDIEIFYSQCIKVIRALPSYIQSSLILKDNDSLKNAEKIFCTIYEYYKILFPLIKNDNSILSYKIDNFKMSFIYLIKILYKSNIKIKNFNIYDLFGISEFELKNDKDILQNEYIIEPKEITFDIPKRKNEESPRTKEIHKQEEIKYEKIEEEKDFKDNISNYSQYDTCDYIQGKYFKETMNKDNNLDEKEYFYNNSYNQINNKNNKKDENIEDRNQYEKINNSFRNYKKVIKNSSLKKIILGNKEYIQNLEEEEKNENDENENKSEHKNIGFIINENITKTIEMNQDKFEDNNFSDSDGIQWILQKIKQIDENDKLNLSNIEGYLPRNIQDNKNDKIDYPILKLSDYLLKLANEIINEVSKLVGPDLETDILFKKMCVILLIDSSCYINNKKKVFNFYILCSFAIALHLLEIPYAISVIADGKFKIILKQFEDQHSFEILEKVYEC